jgi:hypothetical protein
MLIQLSHSPMELMVCAIIVLNANYNLYPNASVISNKTGKPCQKTRSRDLVVGESGLAEVIPVIRVVRSIVQQQQFSDTHLNATTKARDTQNAI